MAKRKVVKIENNAHTLAKTGAWLRGTTLQDMMTTAARYWYPLLDAAQFAVETDEVDGLAELLQEIKNAT